MDVVLREEGFGGILGDAHNYNVRALNRYAFHAIANHVKGITPLTKADSDVLKSRGFDLSSNAIRLVEKHITSQDTLLSAPLLVWLELTSACPLRCAHCFLDGAPSHSKIALPDVKRIVGELAELGVLRLTLTGGEALLHPDIAEILSLINSHKLGLRLFSSGCLPKSKYELLSEHSIDTLFLSVDGLEKHNDELRGEKTFSAFEANLAFLARRPSIRNITISTTLDRANIAELPELIRLAANHGVRTFLLRPLMVYPGTSALEPLAPHDKAAFLADLHEIESLSGRLGVECQINKLPYLPLNKTCFFDDSPKNASLWSVLGIDNSIDCVGGNIVAGIRHDGIVLPCGFIHADYDDGAANSIQFNSFSSLWHKSSNLGKLRKLTPPSACSSCNVLSICNGGCRANAFLDSQRLDSIDPYCIHQDTSFGSRVMEPPTRRPLKAAFPTDSQVFHVSEEVIVSKCGWATYVD